MKTAETKIVENRGETAAVAAAGAGVEDDGEQVTYIALAPFKYKGRDRKVGDKVTFSRVQGTHMEANGFVRLPTADE